MGPGGLRVGHADRNAALAALDVHLGTGRLDTEEYAERAARAAAAVTVADVTALFTDLPAPHPALPGSPGTQAPADARPARFVDAWGPWVIALTPMVAVALFLITGLWIFFLLIPLIGVIVCGRTH